jgi:FixJ family two-component response regulator
MSNEPTVFVVDDDSAVRGAIARLLKSVGLKAETFGSAQEFLDKYDSEVGGCLVLDVRMPGMSGLDLQEALAEKNISLPIVIITGHADVPMAVRALKMGAVNFIEKPFSDQLLLDSIRKAIQQDTDTRQNRARLGEVNERMALLTRRERQVLEMVVAGKTNKRIAIELDLSKKTVEFHRGNVMKKMDVNTVAELIYLFVQHENAS